MTRDAPPLEPLLLEPTVSRRIWGGDRLAPLVGLDPGDDPTPIGEVWSAYSGNRIAEGAWKGATLAEAIDVHGAALLGSAAAARYGTRMPLLAKLIDAAAPLSIQVHPDDAYATTVESASGHLGKGEAWCILDAADGATIVWGWRRDVRADEVRAAVADDTIERLVRTVPIAEGDLVYNPPGLVHAIGAGTLLYEIQQDSDLTYRLYDYGRLGSDGESRELHLDRGLAVADLSVVQEAPIAPGRTVGRWSALLTTPFFDLERGELSGSLPVAAPEHSLAILTPVSGGAELRWSGGALPLAPGRSVVLPAGSAASLCGVGTLFLASVPPLDTERG